MPWAWGIIWGVARPTDAVKIALGERVAAHRAARWPQLTGLPMRFRGEFAYSDADEDGDGWPLGRLRYRGVPDRWGFAVHLGSRDASEESLLPSGKSVGTPEEAIDCACGLYLGDPGAWI
ncbi:MAG: hypothetical protein QG597_3110 [Actinomycetota bacterium]|nr:hypothetical protein [Actinomycetota bacterium]